MSHNIHYNEQTGQHSFFSVKQKAWHLLGKVVEDYPTSAEAIKYAGLDYEVIKTGLFTHSRAMTIGNNGEIIDSTIVPVPDYYATQRIDNNAVLGVVGKDYQIVQNADAFSFFDAIVGGSGIKYETAGALGKGERIFITAKMPSYIRVGNNDVIEKYVFLTTSHDGKGSILAAFTPIRIVCNNTLNAALRNHSGSVTIRHTTGAHQRLKEAHKVMGMVNTLTPLLEETFNQWAKVRITDSDVKKLIQIAMAPNRETLANLKLGKASENSTTYKNMCESVFSYAMVSDTQQLDTTKGTVFGAYNAITGYFQNYRTYKDNDAKLKSLLYGGTAQLRSQTAFNLCAEFARTGSDALVLN